MKKALTLLNYGEKYESFTPKFLREAVRSGVATLPNAMNRKLNRTFLSRDADIENLFFDNFAIFPKAMQTQTFFRRNKGTNCRKKSVYLSLNNWLEETDAKDLLDKLLYADTKTYLHELLMKQDQMSMAASIESRVPFLDHKLVEFTAKLPEKYENSRARNEMDFARSDEGNFARRNFDAQKNGFSRAARKLAEKRISSTLLTNMF